MDVKEPYLLVIGVDNQLTFTNLDHVPDFRELHEAVDGPIEIVPYLNHYMGRPCVAFCNEEGKLEGRPINREAHRLWCLAVGRIITDDVLVGPIAIVVGPQSFLDRL